MDVFELAKQYYPRLWDRERIQALTDGGKLTGEQMEQILEENRA